MKKFLATAATILIVTTTAAATTLFSDVPRGHWAYIPVAAMTDAGIAEGYDDGTFRGDQNITRSEMAKMAANLLLKVSPRSTADAKALVQNFSRDGDKIITRYEIAEILTDVYTKAHTGKLPAAPAAFSDVPSNHPSAKAVNLMAALKIVGGYRDGTFRGERNLTRYEAAQKLYRLYDALTM